MFGSDKPDVNIADYAALTEKEVRAFVDFLSQNDVFDVICSCAKIALPSEPDNGMKKLVDTTAGIMRKFADMELKNSPTLNRTFAICNEAATKDKELKNNFIEKLVYFSLIKKTYPTDKVSIKFENGKYTDVKKAVSDHTSKRYLELSKLQFFEVLAKVKTMLAAQGKK